MFGQIQASHLLIGDLDFRLVLSSCQSRLHHQPGIRGGRSQELEHDGVTRQRLTGPVPADRTKEPMFDLGPFRGTGRIMTHRHRAPRRIHEIMLQALLPQSATIPVTSPAIGQQQQLGRSGPIEVSVGLPPPQQTIDCKLGGVRRGAHMHKPGVMDSVVQAIGDGAPFSQGTKVVDIHAMRVATPHRPGILEQPDQLAFLRIDIQRGPALFNQGLVLALQILELLIAIGTRVCHLFAVDLSRIILIGQQSAHRGRTRGMLLAQRTTDATQAFVLPLERTRGVSRRLIFHHPVQTGQDGRVSFFGAEATTSRETNSITRLAPFPFAPPFRDRLDVEAGHLGHTPVTAISQLLGLQTSIQSLLMFVESAHEEIHLTMQFLDRAGPVLLTLGTFTLMDQLYSHKRSPLEKISIDRHYTRGTLSLLRVQLVRGLSRPYAVS
jgi:hypothetical protein